MSRDTENLPEEIGKPSEDIRLDAVEGGAQPDGAWEPEQTAEQEAADTLQDGEEQSEKKEGKGKGKRRSGCLINGAAISAFVCTTVSLILVTAMLTYNLCQSYHKQEMAALEKSYADAFKQLSEISTESVSGDMELLRKIFESFSFRELNEEEIEIALLKAYVSATGDKYAEYFTEEEYAQFYSDRLGESQGIGINIINTTVEYNGSTIKTLRVINVMKNSPAAAAELKYGDCIIAVGNFDEYTMLNELGYDRGLTQLRGAKGTVAEFIVYRPSEARSIEFKVTRDTYTAYSVLDGIVVDSEVSGKTGLIKILQFDKTTPEAMAEEIEELKAKGCERFVFDLRDNPGGSLTSIVATLSYFLNEGDKVISMKDKYGNEKVYYANPVTYSESSAENSILKENIGKYRGLDMVVLCNGGTASAAELFVANVRDYNLGAVIGSTTYGKGTVQTTYAMSSFVSPDYKGELPSGWIKLTVYMYFPPNGESYDGIGIVPDYEVELSEEALKESIYDILGTSKDDQLTEAVKHFKNSTN